MDGKGTAVKRAALWLNRYFEVIFIVIILAATSVIIFGQVIARYVFDDSFYWSEEIARYLFIWLVYIALSYAVRVDKHIRMDTLLSLNLLSDSWKKIVCLLADGIFLGFALVIAYLGGKVLVVTIQRGQIMPSTELPMYLVYAAMPLGYFLCSFRLIQRIVFRLRHFHADFITFSRPLGTLNIMKVDEDETAEEGAC